MKFDTVVGQIIAIECVDHFSALEIRTAYIAIKNDPSINRNDARRFIYTELLKLVKKGWLKKSVSKKKEITSFIKTEMFDATAVTVNSEIYVEKKKEANLAETTPLDETLIKRLSHYKNDLLTGLGEAEEYKRLCEQFPKLKSKLQPRYNEVREHNSKLLGSIKAVENLI
jgi:5-methylthioribose kinase